MGEGILRGLIRCLNQRELEKIRRYIQQQEAEDRRLDQFEFSDQQPPQTDRKQN